MICDGDCHFLPAAGSSAGARSREAASTTSRSRRRGEISGNSAHEFRERSSIHRNGRPSLPSGAEAVYRSLGYNRCHRFLTWCYEHVPGFARISEAAYSFIARHRDLRFEGYALALGRRCAASDLLRCASAFFSARSAIVYLIAFVSLWVQVDGLIGANGILPVRELLAGGAGAGRRTQRILYPADALLA